MEKADSSKWGGGAVCEFHEVHPYGEGLGRNEVSPVP